MQLFTNMELTVIESDIPIVDQLIDWLIDWLIEINVLSIILKLNCTVMSCFYVTQLKQLWQ